MLRVEFYSNAVSRFAREIPEGLMDNRIQKSRFSLDESDPPAYSGLGSGYKRPVAVPRKKETPPEVRPYITGGGLGSLHALGVSKGVPGGTVEAGVKPDYDIGDRVRHVKFGEGTVTDLEPGPRDFKVTVDFDDAGTKVMYAAFAKLIKV